MCSEYDVRATKKSIDESLDLILENLTEQDSWDIKVKFTVKAPAIELADGKLKIITRIFPAQPFPNARLSGVERDTPIDDDDLIKRIYEMPTWKKGFAERPLLLPMTTFLEPAYWGPNKGDVVGFGVPENKIMFAAGIEIKPRVPHTNALDAFALLTHTATKQMLDYHQRLVVVFKPKDAVGYLRPQTAEERFNYIINNRYTGPLNVSKKRTMVKGWEKRVDIHTAALRREERYISTLMKERILG